MGIPEKIDQYGPWGPKGKGTIINKGFEAMINQLIKPIQKDDALLQDIHKASAAEEVFHLWWLGQSGFLLKWQDKHLLIDPYLSDSLTKKYENTDKPHIRMTERVIDPERFDFIDVVTSSHNHTDHLDGKTLQPIIKKNPGIEFIVPEANREFVANRVETDKNFPIGLNDGEEITVKGFHITAVPAAHETIERDENNNCRFLGYVIQFGPHTVYHSGDTMLYDNVVEILSKFSVDVAMLPINGKDSKRKVAGNLNALEAARLGRDIGAGMVIPCHYDMFTFNTADPEEFKKEAEAIGQPYRVLQCGERWSNTRETV
jgi:L-ascorbate metabolism protein UlaG (beta-lactamase superfamily)